MVDTERPILYQLIIFVFSIIVDSKECKEGCCLNYYKHQNGSCLECPLGTHGVNCSGTCVNGFYGRLCKSACGCSSNKCDRKYGCAMQEDTTIECPLGTHGVNCSDTCDNGFYGRFCRSKCECSIDKCDKKYGCTMQEDTRNDTSSPAIGPDSANGQRASVAYILIGSITTTSVVGLLCYWKSWYSKRRSPNLEIGQMNSMLLENRQEPMRERRGNFSARETDNARSLLQGQRNYTDLHLSEVQPGTSGRADTNTVPPSIAAISPQGRDINCYDEVEYEHFDSCTVYNVLSLRRNFHGSLLKPVELSSTIDQSSSNMENEYDLMNISHDKEVPPEKERKRSEEEAVRQRLIYETVKEYIDKSQLMKEMDMKDDTDEHQLKMTSKGIGLLLRKSHRTETSPRAYSLAENIWSTGNASEYEDILSNLVKEEVDEVCCCKNGKDNEKRCSIKTENETNNVEPYTIINIENDKELVVQNINAYETTNSQITMKETREILLPGQTDVYSQVRRRSDTCCESSTSSVEVFIPNEESREELLTISVVSVNDDMKLNTIADDLSVSSGNEKIKLRHSF